jgi:hypothetical protein
MVTQRVNISKAENFKAINFRDVLMKSYSSPEIYTLVML